MARQDGIAHRRDWEDRQIVHSNFAQPPLPPFGARCPPSERLQESGSSSTAQRNVPVQEQHALRRSVAAGPRRSPLGDRAVALLGRRRIVTSPWALTSARPDTDRQEEGDRASSGRSRRPESGDSWTTRLAVSSPVRESALQWRQPAEGVTVGCPRRRSKIGQKRKPSGAVTNASGDRSAGCRGPRWGRAGCPAANSMVEPV